MPSKKTVSRSLRRYKLQQLYVSQPLTMESFLKDLKKRKVLCICRQVTAKQGKTMAINQCEMPDLVHIGDFVHFIGV